MVYVRQNTQFVLDLTYWHQLLHSSLTIPGSNEQLLGGCKVTSDIQSFSWMCITWHLSLLFCSWRRLLPQLPSPTLPYVLRLNFYVCVCVLSACSLSSQISLTIYYTINVQFVDMSLAGIDTVEIQSEISSSTWKDSTLLWIINIFWNLQFLKNRLVILGTSQINLNMRIMCQ